MTSIVDTSVKHFPSDICPVVHNALAGSLVALFDALLVNGYGQQTATSLTVTDGVATLIFPQPFPIWVDMVIEIAGATPAGHNGEQKVISYAANTVRYATALPNGTATGTIVVKVAPAGWLKVFSGTNKAAYKSKDPMAWGGGMFLRVDDTAINSARVVAYESMTDIDTGFLPFPTPVQIAGGLYWAKTSVTGSTVPVKYLLAADSRTLIFHTVPGIPSSATFRHGVTRGFGDLISQRPGGDPFAVFLNGSVATSFTAQTDDGLDCHTAPSTANTTVPRAMTGLGGAQIYGMFPLGGGGGISGATGILGAFPNEADGALFMGKIALMPTASGNPRAYLPGLRFVPQANAYNGFSLFDIAPGVDDLAGRRFMAVNPSRTSSNSGVSATNAGVSFIDVTGPWR